ncbi:MAG TPA: protein jag [Clostridia bacterium]|nr:protein jag [Clostridia bacterium]
MSSIEITAKTVEDAVETALKELQVDREQIEVDVLEEGSKGLFGILGSRMARVKVTVKEDPLEIGKEFLRPIIKSMGVEVTTEERKEGDYYYLSFSGSKLGIIIGHRGETLDALQYLTNLAINKKVKNRVHFILDVEGYRKKREATLIRLAQRLSEKAKRTGKKVMLEPMSPQERRIIHTALQNDPLIQTYSEGEEPFRKVVISVK